MTVQALSLEQAPAYPWVAEPAVPSRPRNLRVVCEGEVARSPRLVLTARGRLVRTLIVFGALSLLALVMWARLTAPVLPPTRSITVEPGQSLTQIATEHLPMVPVEAAVVRIQLANGLNGTSVVAGQDLVIPGSTD